MQAVVIPNMAITPIRHLLFWCLLLSISDYFSNWIHLLSIINNQLVEEAFSFVPRGDGFNVGRIGPYSEVILGSLINKLSL